MDAKPKAEASGRKPVSDFTAIIKTFERPKVCQRLIDSVRKFYPNVPIIVADDSRQPNEYQNAHTLKMPFNVGLSKGRNELVDNVDTPYFLLLDDDFIFTPKTKIENFVQVLDHTHVDLIGGKLDNIIRGKRKPYHWQRIFWKVDNQLWLKHGKHYEISGVSVCDTVLNFFLARTDVVRELRWDERLKVVEHTDFFLRAKLFGLTVGYTHSVVVDHKRHGGTPTYRKHRHAVGKHKRMMLNKWGFKALRYGMNPTGGVEFDPTDGTTHKYRGVEYENHVGE